MEFPDRDLAAIHLRKSQFIAKFGAHDIATDIEELLQVVADYRRKEREYGWLDEDAKMIIAGMRHLSTRKHQYDPTNCAGCDEARKVMLSIKGGEL